MQTTYKLPPKTEIYRLLISLKREIDDDYRASDDPFDDQPGMNVTIACNEHGKWNYQTGDNSFTGGAYGLPHWAVISLYRRSNCLDLTNDVMDQLSDSMAQ